MHRFISGRATWMGVAVCAVMLAASGGCEGQAVERTAAAAAPTTTAATATTTRRVTTTAAPARDCDPSYPDACLHDGIGDYDCAGGSGNGPNYVSGPIEVLSPDPFRLDADGDGVGCES